MSLSQLSKYVDRRREELSLSVDQSINTNTPFWLWEDPDHYNNKIAKGKCCFNHMIGAPTKLDDDGKKISMPLLPYQKTLYDSLQLHRRLLIMKSRGLGVSEFFLRYIAWNCLTGRFGDDGRVCIGTGPRLQTAQDLMLRLKNLLAFQNDEKSYSHSTSTELEVNGVIVSCFPSYNSSSLRGYDRVKFLMFDEVAWWPAFQATEIMSIITGYQSKPNSNPQVVLISTPNKPTSLIQQLSEDSNSMFHKHYFDYKYGMVEPWPLYSSRQLDISRQSREFPREFELQPIGESGSVFSAFSLEQAQQIDYNPDAVIPSNVSVGVDPSYGSSNFAIVATRLVNGIIQVIVAEEHEREHAAFTDMINRISMIRQKHGINVLYCDAANPEIITQLKRDVFHEEYRDHIVKEKIKMAEDYGHPPSRYMRVVPIAFSKHGSHALQNAKSLMDDDRVAIHKQFTKLLIGLRTANAEEYKLNKEDTSYDDTVDAFRLALLFYERARRG